ncbi:MAG: hypothetical protein AMJ79_12725 [Phycisphaerae bacterium SM23_30]|jgi:hypothetical protein|nr:MAG: hypothetical protein AMJ79_12725 [Phycisphaerae bacterium SM23_30]
MKIVNLLFVLVLVFTSSCSEAQEEAIQKELPALLGPGTTIRIKPTEVWRGKQEDFTITITLGKGGLPANESVGVVNGSYIDRWKFSFASHWWGKEKPWQTTDEKKSNYVTATCSRQGINLKLKVGEEGPAKPFVNTPDHFVRSLRERMRFVLDLSSDRNLRAGDIITLRWKRVQAPDYAMRYFFLPFRFSQLPKLDRDLPIRGGGFYSLPSIRVKGHSAEYLYVTCRPLHAINERFSLNVAAIDKYGNLAEDFSGAVKLITDCDNNFPKTVILSKDDRGRKRIQNLTIYEAGWHRIRAEGNNVSGTSNYLVISNKKPSERLYFGDMHVHTLDCDGTNDILEHFFYAPKVAGLDFGTVSPHAEYFGCKQAWDRYLKETTKANKPGEFVTFYGYEWAQEGHTNAYFLSEEDAVLIWGEKRMKAKGYPEDNPTFRIGAKSEREFMDILGKLKQSRPLFTIAHIHSAYHDLHDSIHWLDEIYSIHKVGRKRRENRLRKNLQKGLRLGVVAGSDMHRLTMGHLCDQPGEVWSYGDRGGWDQTGGIQATFASDLTRKELYTGMKNRHTYGTSGARIVLLFNCNNALMGSQIKLTQDDKPKFSIEVGGMADLSEVAICRFDGDKWSEPMKIVLTEKATDRYSGSWEDMEFNRTGIYYVRVTQKNGEQAWSSPIWINI